MRKAWLRLSCLFLVVALSTAAFQEKDYDVPFVPTPHEVVEEMLRMVDVKKGDILYDLGCGDGRIVITAAQKFGIRGVGIDIDPLRIKESRENAVKAGVTHLVRFMEQDLFDSEIHEASVVTLYLLTSVNLRLRPKLLRELTPGTRVVSHNYGMDDWWPDQMSEVDQDYDSHKVYFWVIPANVSGVWEWSMKTSSGKENYLMELDQKFQRVRGKITVGKTEISLAETELVGDKLRFTVRREEGGRVEIQAYEGRIKGDVLEGIVMTEATSPGYRKNWTAKRRPLTMKPFVD